MTVPISTKVSDERVHALLQSLHEVRVKAFIAETPAVLQPYGLETPTLRLTLDLGKTQPVQTLLLGKVDEARQGVYAKGWTTCRFFKRVPVT